MTPAELKRRALRMQCRRGMLELDILLATFFDRYFDELTPMDQQLFEQVLMQEDPTLWQWFIEADPPQEPELRALVLRITATRFASS